MKLLTSTFLRGIILIGLTSTGCASRSIHSDLTPDNQVLVRQWTRVSKTEWLAGEKGSEHSSAVFYENTLIFGNSSQGVQSIYPGLNLVRWKRDIPQGVMSRLQVQKKSLYFGGGDGNLYSLNADTGEVQWKYPLRNPIVSRPTISGGRLFVTTSDDTLYAFDAGTGEWLWHYKRRTSQDATVLGASEPLVDGEEVIAGMSDGYLVAVSVQDGKLKWDKKIHSGIKFTDVDAHPILWKQTLFVPSYDGAFYALGRAGREVKWKFDSGASKGVLLHDDKAYLPSSDGNVYCIDPNNGRSLWSFELDGGVPTDLVIAGDLLVFGSSDRYLYALDLKSGKGKFRWDAGSKSGFSGNPIYDEALKRIYVLSNAGNLYSFSITPIPTRVRPLGRTQPYEFYKAL